MTQFSQQAATSVVVPPQTSILPTSASGNRARIGTYSLTAVGWRVPNHISSSPAYFNSNQLSFSLTSTFSTDIAAQSAQWRKASDDSVVAAADVRIEFDMILDGARSFDATSLPTSPVSAAKHYSIGLTSFTAGDSDVVWTDNLDLVHPYPNCAKFWMIIGHPALKDTSGNYVYNTALDNAGIRMVGKLSFPGTLDLFDDPTPFGMSSIRNNTIQNDTVTYDNSSWPSSDWGATISSAAGTVINKTRERGRTGGFTEGLSYTSPILNGSTRSFTFSCMMRICTNLLSDTVQLIST